MGSASPGVGRREGPQDSKGSRLGGESTVPAGEREAEAREKEGKGSKRGIEGGGALSEGEAKKVDMMVRMIGELYPRERWAAKDVRKLVEEAYQATDGNYGEKEAQEWGADFK